MNYIVIYAHSMVEFRMDKCNSTGGVQKQHATEKKLNPKRLHTVKNSHHNKAMTRCKGIKE